MLPIITLAIPSRQAPESLYSSLEIIKEEIERYCLLDALEVLISLNPPVTLGIDSRRLETLTSGWARLVKPGKDLSYDDHLNFIVGQARGRWLKFLADDDELEVGGLRILFEAVERQPDLECLVHDFSYWQPKPASFQHFNLVTLSNGQMPGPWGQVSTTMFHRERWLETPRLTNSNYLHVFKFEYIASMALHRAFYLPQALVKVRPGAPNFSSTPYVKAFVASQSLQVLKELTVFGARAFVHNERLRSDILYFMRTMAHARANGAKELLALALRVARLWPSYSGVWATFIVCLTPRSILKQISRLVSRG